MDRTSEVFKALNGRASSSDIHGNFKTPIDRRKAAKKRKQLERSRKRRLTFSSQARQKCGSDSDSSDDDIVQCLLSPDSSCKEFIKDDLLIEARANLSKESEVWIENTLKTEEINAKNQFKKSVEALPDFSKSNNQITTTCKSSCDITENAIDSSFRENGATSTDKDKCFMRNVIQIEAHPTVSQQRESEERFQSNFNIEENQGDIHNTEANFDESHDSLLDFLDTANENVLEEDSTHDSDETTVYDEDKHTAGVRKIRNFLLSLRGKHGMSKTGIDNIYSFFCRDNVDLVHELKNANKLPSSFETLRESARKELPKIYVTYTYKTDDNKLITKWDENALPKFLTLQRHRLIKAAAYIKLSDLLKYYKHNHDLDDCNLSDFQYEAEISSDGVQESGHGARKLHIISICINPCQSPFPFVVWEYLPGHAPSLQELYQPVVADLNLNSIKLKRVIADGKEQNFVRGMITTNGYFGCGWCKSKGVWKFNKVIYPYKELVDIDREHTFWKNLFEVFPECFESTGNFVSSQQIRCGVEQKSPLLDLDYFNIVEDVPLDAMHLIHLGITKETWKRIFETNIVFAAKLRKRYHAIATQQITAMKVPSEIKRRTREVNPANMKANEWQMIDMFYFIEFAEALEGHEDLKEVLYIYVFLIRICYHDDTSFKNLESLLDLKKIQTRFYKLYARVFGENWFTFNLHVFYHFIRSRKANGPLWTHSTHRYEGTYSRTRKCYAPNAPAPFKQLLFNFYALDIQNHRCYQKKGLHINDRTTEKSDDSIIYYQGRFFKVTAVSGENLECQLIQVKPLNTSKVVKLPWPAVGIYKFLGTTSKTTTIHVNDVEAKAVISGSLISTCYPEWLIC